MKYENSNIKKAGESFEKFANLCIAIAEDWKKSICCDEEVEYGRCKKCKEQSIPTFWFGRKFTTILGPWNRSMLWALTDSNRYG